MNDEELKLISEEAEYGGLHRTDALILVAECVRLRAELAELKATLYIPCVERGGGDNPEMIEVIECHDKMKAELAELRTAAQAAVDADRMSDDPARSLTVLVKLALLAQVLERGNQ